MFLENPNLIKFHSPNHKIRQISVYIFIPCQSFYKERRGWILAININLGFSEIKKGMTFITPILLLKIKKLRYYKRIHSGSS